MVKGKKGILKKTGCILISASIILTGVTFFGSSISEADVEETENTASTETTDNESSDVDLPGGAEVDFTDPTDEGAAQDDGAEPTDGDGETSDSSDGSIDSADDGSEEVTTPSETTEEVGEETTEETAEEASTETEETTDVAPTSLMSARRTLSTAALTATSTYTDPSTGAVYTDSSMSTLVSVPSGLTDFEVPSSVTTIQSNAFDGSNVTTLTFANANNVSSIGSMTSWPASGTTINLNGADNDAYAVEFYRNLSVALLQEGTTITVINGSSDTDPSTPTYSVAIIETAADGSFNEVLAYTNMTAGTVITPTARSGYTCNDSFTVTSSSSQTHTFTYTANSEDTTTYTVTIIEAAADGSFVSAQLIYTEKAVGDVIYPTARSGYTCSDSYTVTAEEGQSHTFTYTKTSDDSGTVTYSVTITEKASDGSFSETLNYSKLVAGTVISPTARSGYTCSDTYTVTTSSSQSHTFTYTKNSSSGGSSSGSSSGGSSSSGGGSSKATATPANVSEAAKTTASYVVIEGAGQVVGQKDGAVRIVCNGPVEKLVYILMDGNIVPSGNYSIASGSTILTLSADYISNLAIGDHAVQFQYTDGYAITGLRINAGATRTTTTVTYKVASDGTISAGHTKDATPKTADGFDTRYLLCLAIFLLGAGAIQLSKQKNLEAILAGERPEY